VSDVHTRRSWRYSENGGASRITGKGCTSHGNDNAVEDPSACAVTADQKRTALILDVSQPDMLQDVGDLRAELIMELLLRHRGLVRVLCTLDVH